MSAAETKTAANPLDALSVDTAGWAGDARSAALSRLRQMGLPTKRDEYWKYTDPSTLTAQEAPKAALFDAGEAQLFDDVERLKIVFVDGVFDAAASDDLSLENVELSRLADTASADIHWAKSLYGELEANGQSPVERPLAAMNTAMASDGVLMRVTGKVSKPVSLIYHHKSESSDAILHHVIKVEAGGDITLTENGPAAARFNKVMEVDIADGAAFHHVRAQGRDHERRAVTHIFTRLGAESTFKSFTLTANGGLEDWLARRSA